MLSQGSCSRGHLVPGGIALTIQPTISYDSHFPKGKSFRMTPRLRGDSVWHDPPFQSVGLHVATAGNS